jgi:hypothetical protein
LVTRVERLIKERVSPLILSEQASAISSSRAWGYVALCWLGTYSCIVYLFQSFYTLSWERSLASWKAYNYLGHKLIFAAYLSLAMLVPVPPSVAPSSPAAAAAATEGRAKLD